MKIISTVQATKNSITAVSGSTMTPTFNHVAAVGSQLMDDAMGEAASPLVVTALMNTTMLATKESPAPASATLWLARLDRLAKSTINANPSRGGSGINQRSEFIVNMVLVHQPFNASRSLATTVRRFL